MILCKEIGKHFPNKIFSIGRCFVFDSINWIGSLISNGYWYNCSCAWCGPWASYYFTWWMLKWTSFFFYQNVFCLLVVSVCLKFIFHHFQSQCVLVYRARRGRGICYQIQIIVQSLQKGEIFQIFFKLKKAKFLINCTLKFVLTKHRAITAQSIKNRKVFPYTVY